MLPLNQDQLDDNSRIQHSLSEAILAQSPYSKYTGPFPPKPDHFPAGVSWPFNHNKNNNNTGLAKK